MKTYFSFKELENFLMYCKKLNFDNKVMYESLKDFIFEEIELIENAVLTTKIYVDHENKIIPFELKETDIQQTKSYFHAKKGKYLCDITRTDFYESFIQWSQINQIGRAHV